MLPGSACDHFDPCTQNDVCNQMASDCAGTEIECAEDGDLCTQEFCSNGTCESDERFCPGSGPCTMGLCDSGTGLDTGTLSGGGSIHANGGPGDDQNDDAGGGGGGGRVALYFDDASGFDLGNVEALGGQGVTAGEPGTVQVEP